MSLRDVKAGKAEDNRIRGLWGFWALCVFFLPAGLSLALGPGLAQAQAESGRDIALLADGVDTSQTSSLTVAMTIRRGQQRLSRVMSIKRKKYPDGERQLIRFLEPPDIRDAAYLIWTYRDFRQDDDMWVFMPAESLVRRISGGGRKGPFMRSDYANEDMSRREVDEDDYERLGDEDLSGVPCHVLEARAVFPGQTGYAKRKVWIRKDVFLPARIEYYGPGERLLKELVFGGFEPVQGIWTARRQRMRDRLSDSETLMEITEVSYDDKLPDQMFLQQDLKR
jgi:hypothetical protein